MRTWHRKVLLLRGGSANTPPACCSGKHGGAKWGNVHQCIVFSQKWTAVVIAKKCKVTKKAEAEASRHRGTRDFPPDFKKHASWKYLSWDQWKQVRHLGAQSENLAGVHVLPLCFFRPPSSLTVEHGSFLLKTHSAVCAIWSLVLLKHLHVLLSATETRVLPKPRGPNQCVHAASALTAFLALGTN